MRRQLGFLALIVCAATLAIAPTIRAQVLDSGAVTVQGTFDGYQVTVKKWVNDTGFNLTAYLTGLPGARYDMINATDFGSDGRWDRIVICPGQGHPKGGCARYEADVLKDWEQMPTGFTTELQAVTPILREAVISVAPVLAPWKVSRRE